ncbi:unnamed protein product [Peniophora sp. CBMAI 1063]|nr:unnamed protein product [Peniophora sp. CBMAI 1063]
MASFSGLRIFLYGTLWVFAVVELALTAVRLHYTLTFAPGDPLNGGRHFYDPVNVELLVTSCLAILWAPHAIHAISRRRDRGFVTSFTFENIALFILWVMMLVGAAYATHLWGGVSYCWKGYWQCRELSAMLAFAWMSWIIMTFLWILAIFIPTRNSAWDNQPMHGYYLGPRESLAPETAQYRA